MATVRNPGAAEALAAAEQLAVQGRFLDAVELLTEANRRETDPEIELRLVRLRNAAYAELDRSPTDSPWPEDTTLAREGDEALPPIDRAQLTPAAVRDSLMRYGCAFIPGLIAKDDVDLLVEGIDRAFSGCDEQAARGWSRETAGEEAAEGVEVIRPLFEPGDALLFDEMFLHRTATDETMTRDRYAIETWFFAPSLYPGDQIPFIW